MTTPAAVTYAKSAGLLVGTIAHVQPILSRSTATIGEIMRRDPSPLLLAVINELAYVGQELSRAVAEAAAIQTAERTRRELNIKED